MRAHIRIEKQPGQPGKPQIVTNDKIYAVDEDGTTIDISSVCRSWHEHATVGEPRTIEIVLLGYHITQLDGSTELQALDPALA